MTLTAQSIPFTWEGADFTWEDTYAAKSWDDIAINCYTFTCDETLTLTSRKRNDARARYAARVTLDERTCRAPTVCRLNTSTLSDALARIARYRRNSSEMLALTEKNTHSACLPRHSTVTLSEHTARLPVLHRSTALALTDTHRPHLRYRRTLDERIPLASRTARKMTHIDRAQLTLTDAHLPPYQGTLSDVTFTTDPLTDALWDRIASSPSGYGAFHPFEVGEYTYRNALVRLLLTTGAAGAQPLLYDVAFHVDIEDVREHGLADCTADAPTHIILSRAYHHPPRIALTAVYASADTLAVPHLVSQSTEDGRHTFDCELRTTDGTRIAGTVSYLAEGY